MLTKKPKQNNRPEGIPSGEILIYGILGAVAEIGYVFLVATLLTFLERVVPHPPTPSFGIAMFLLIFVFSAAISAILVFGYPAYLGLRGRVGEAFMMVGVSIATFVVVGLFFLLLIPLL